jgi:hypothetical protein
MDLKLCGGCKHEFPTAQFNKKGTRLQNICKGCQKESSRAYYEKNKEKMLSLQKEKYSANPEEYRKRKRDYTKNNKAAVKKANSKYYCKNVSKFREQSWKYKKRLKIAAPTWLTDTQKKEIEDFYFLARDCSKVSCEQYHVDHIIPLNGKNVCGLHVPWNLQILPAHINLSKSNREI